MLTDKLLIYRRNFSVLMKLLWYLQQIRPDQYEVCLLVAGDDDDGGGRECWIQQVSSTYILKSCFDYNNNNNNNNNKNKK